MEVLAFTHAAIAYEEPASSSAEISLHTPRVSWLGLMAAIATLVTSNVAPALALGLGDAGLGVEQLQIALQGRSLYDGGINGFYGPRTETAVRAFQRENEITVTGVADAQTLNLLGLDSGFVSETVTPVRPTQSTFGTSQDYYGTSASFGNSGARSSGVVKTVEGFGINVRRTPAGQIIGGQPDGAVVRYNPATTTRVGGYTWVQTNSGGWVASEYLRGGYGVTPYY